MSNIRIQTISLSKLKKFVKTAQYFRNISLAFCNVKFFFVSNLSKIYSYKYYFHWIEISMKAVLRIHTSVFVTVKYF